MIRRLRCAGAIGGGLAGALALPAVAAAHGVSGRADVPVSRVVVAITAVSVVMYSFIGLLGFWSRPRLDDARWRPLPGGRALASMPVRVALGAVGVACLALVIVAGLAGTASASLNIAPQLVFVQLWVGLAAASALLGGVFHALSPWRALGSLLFRGPPRRAYPARLGRWPAVAGVLGFALLELVAREPAEPRRLGALALAYTVVTLLAMRTFGVEAWHRDGELFAVYLDLLGRVSPLAVRDRVLGLTLPLAGLARYPRRPGTAALVVVLIGSVTFDGLAENRYWLRLAAHLRDGLAAVLGDAVAVRLTSLVGLALAIGVVGAVYLAACATTGDGRPAREVAVVYAPSLAPIALAYVGAHYLTSLVFQSQRLIALASDPLGRGWDLFGTATSTVDYTVASATTIGIAQVVLVVLGHVAGLAVAHDRALVEHGGRTAAVLRSQAGLFLAMVAYTCLALWLLSETNR